MSPTAGGPATSVPATAFGLVEITGCDPHVLGTIDKAAPDAWRDWGPRVHPHAAGLGRFGYAPEMLRTMAALNPDISDVQGLWVYPSLANLRYHKRFARPYVITPRGMLEPWALKRSPFKKKVVSFWFESSHLQQAACLRATAESEARNFREFGLKQPIAIVPNGVELPPTGKSRSPDRLNRILFLSRVHPKKGLPFLLRAWLRLHRDFADWELAIAGPDEVGHLMEMQALSHALNLPRVSWIGSVSGVAKQTLYDQSDLFVLPTHSENFGLVIAEALASSVPVITTTGAPWGQLESRQCGWWIDLTEDNLVDTMTTAMRLSSDERSRMGVNGRAWMEQDFSWAKVAKELSGVYRWILGGGSPPPNVITT